MTATCGAGMPHNAAPGCFAGHETVDVEAVGPRPISSVKVGDRILSARRDGSFLYSPIVAVPHKTNSVHSAFLRISLEGGSEITLTPDHLLLAGSCGGVKFALLAASAVAPGKCLSTAAGEEVVVGVRASEGRGLYTVIVEAEYIVVSGIVSSPFAKNHGLPHFFYGMHRILFRTFRGLATSSLMSDMSDRIGSVVAAAYSAFSF